MLNNAYSSSLSNGSRNNGSRSTWKKASSVWSSSSSMWTGNLRIGVTTKNPTSLISSELPEFSYPTLQNVEGYWITCIKSTYLRTGNKISLVLDKDNSLQLAINYVVKATLFGNNMIPNTAQTKLWLILDIYGATNLVQFLPSGLKRTLFFIVVVVVLAMFIKILKISNEVINQFLSLDETPYEIKERGLDAINNFHSACLSGGSKSIYKTRLLLLGQDEAEKVALKNSLVNFK